MVTHNICYYEDLTKISFNLHLYHQISSFYLTKVCPIVLNEQYACPRVSEISFKLVKYT